MNVYLTRINGIEIVSESFRHAMRSAAVLLVPDGGKRERLKRLDRSPELVAVNAAGSFYQMLRYVNERGAQADFRIYEHALGGPPGLPTISRVVDLNEGLDPSYEVQAALWDVALHGDGTPEQAAADIEQAIADGISAMRAQGTEDASILTELMWVEERMGGLKVIPATGRAAGVLDRLPNASAAMFTEILGEAFPG